MYSSGLFYFFIWAAVVAGQATPSQPSQSTPSSARELANARPACAQQCYREFVPKTCPNGIYDFHCQCQIEANRGAIYNNIYPCIQNNCHTVQEQNSARTLSIAMCDRYNQTHPASEPIHLSTPDAVGIAIGSLVAFFLIAGLAAFFLIRSIRRKRQAQRETEKAELGAGEDKEAWLSITSSSGSRRFPRELPGEGRPHLVGGGSIYEMPPGIDGLHELPGFRSPIGGMSSPMSYNSYMASLRRMSI